MQPLPVQLEPLGPDQLNTNAKCRFPGRTSLIDGQHTCKGRPDHHVLKG